MYRILLTALLSTSLAGQAAALSCAAPDVGNSFLLASEAEAEYVLAVGRIQIARGQTIPDTGAVDPNNRQGYSLQGRFVGQVATAEGFTDDAIFPVTVDVQCAGAWCGGVSLKRVIAFVERRGEENVIVENPCNTLVIPASPARIAQAEACIKGEDACTAPAQ